MLLWSRSIEKPEEKQSWFNLMPLMNDEQIVKLEDILTREKQKLEEIEKKYEEKKIEIGDQIAMEEREAIVAWAALAMPRLLEKSDYTIPQSHLHLENEFSNTHGLLKGLNFILEVRVFTPASSDKFIEHRESSCFFRYVTEWERISHSIIRIMRDKLQLLGEKPIGEIDSFNGPGLNPTR